MLFHEMNNLLVAGGKSAIDKLGLIELGNLQKHVITLGSKGPKHSGG